MPFVYPLQGDTSSGYLHPQVGGILLTAADLLGLPLPIDYGTVASGAAGAGGCSVGVSVDFRFRQGRRRSHLSPLRSSLHPRIPSLAWVPRSRTIRCSRSTSRFACWWSRSAFARLSRRRRCSSVSSRPSRYRLAVLSFLASRMASALSRRTLRTYSASSRSALTNSSAEALSRR